MDSMMVPHLNQLGMLLLSAGGLSLVQAVRGFLGARRGLDWPTATGRIVTSRATHGLRGEEYPSVFYEYVVDGKKYASDTIWSGESASHHMPGDLDHILSTYVVGADVTVHFDPGAPDRSYLERRRARAVTLFAAAGILLMIAGFTSLLIAGSGTS